MRITSQRADRGIALVIVMMVIIVLSVLAGGFAYSMKVETKLARNTAWESDMEWLGRSGVEYGKYAIAMQLTVPPPDGAYRALNQVWAGGPPNLTNEVLANINLVDHPLGPGKFTVTIRDLERKFSLAAVTESNPAILERALDMVGADSGDIPTIIDSYFDWIDPDHRTHLAGAESPEYLAMPAPYYAKNGPVDDIRELLLIKGMTEQIFWGTSRVPHVQRDTGGKPQRRRAMSPYLEGLQQTQSSGVGLVDLFVPVHGGGATVNINTASAEVLQLVPGVDAPMAQSIVQQRNGPDGQAGTEDDAPYLNPGEALQAVGADPIMIQAMLRLFTVSSARFEITVVAQIGTYERTFVALVDCKNRQQVDTLSFTWK